MIARPAATLTLLFSIAAARAPYQCGRSPDPSIREETPAEALYRMAQALRAEGDEQGYRMTLRTIVERYPSSRFAVRAKADLGEGDADLDASDAP